MKNIKRITSTFLTIVILSIICIQPASSVATTEEYQILTLKDARKILMYASGIESFDHNEISKADINHDGYINTYDAHLALDVAAGIKRIPLHSYSNWHLQVSPTCTEDGYEHRECLICGEDFYRILPAKGHSPVGVTCTTEGYCSDCGQTIAPTGHNYVNSVCINCNSISLQSFEPYTVGLLSDVHISTENTDDTKSQTDFTRAINYYNLANPKMVLVAGDLTAEGTDDEFAKYNELKNTSNVPYYETTGNHEASSRRTYKSNITDSNCIAYKFYDLIGKDFCYYLKGNKYVGWKLRLDDDGIIQSETVETETNVTIPEGDVYIFVGVLGDVNNGLFFQEELQWLKDVLEENRNNRCFVIEHCRADRLKYDSTQNKYIEDRYANYVSGNYGSKYIKALWGQAHNTDDGKFARCFEELMSHYTNCIWLHGHSHMSAKTGVNRGVNPYLYDTHFGDSYNAWNFDASANSTKYSYSIHVSSCAEPREETGVNSNGSEGCLMFVERDSITIKYIDFTTNEILTECKIPTSRDTIEKNTFSDPTNLVV